MYDMRGFVNQTTLKEGVRNWVGKRCPSSLVSFYLSATSSLGPVQVNLKTRSLQAKLTRQKTPPEGCSNH